MAHCTSTRTRLLGLALLAGSLGAAVLADKPPTYPKDPGERAKLMATLGASTATRIDAALVRALRPEGQSPALPRCVACQGGDVIEVEADCGFPLDTTNGGCNSTPPVFGVISAGQTVCGSAQSDFNPADPNFLLRDTDWYEITLASSQELSWTVSAQFDALVGVVDTNGVPGCPASVFRSYAFGAACSEITVRVCLPAGTWYLFVAPDFFGATFPVACGSTYRATASVGDCPPPPPSDECTGAVSIPCEGSASVDNSAATENVTDPVFSCAFGGPSAGYGTVWFNFVAASSGATLDTDLSVTIDDTLLAVYSGDCESLTEIGCDDDGGVGLLSRVSVSGLSAGSTYYVQVGGFAAGTPRGLVVVRLSCAPPPPPPAHDVCSGAVAIACGSSNTTDNTSATTDANDPIFTCVGTQGSRSLWYTFVAGAAVATIDTEGSTIGDTMLQVYSGTCGSLTVIGCDDDSGTGFLSSVSLTGLTPGTTYYIESANYSPSTTPGLMTVNVSCAPPPPPPAHDVCSGAVAIACGGSNTTNNTSATTDPNDPTFTCVGSQGSRSLWYTFVPGGTTATIDTEGSTISDTLLQVYSGTCGSLTVIGCDDDGGTGLLSLVNLTGLTPGTTYYIESANFSAGTAPGNMRVNVACAGAPCPGDADGDGDVDQDDLDLVLFNFGTTGWPPNTNGDVDGDGDVDQDDLDLTLFYFGVDCP